jgi:hypothetical protein
MQISQGMTLKMLGVAGMAVFFSFPLGNAFATTVTSLNPAWLLVPGSGTTTPTWYLPEVRDGADPAAEPVGDFVFSQKLSPIFGAGLYLTITGDDGTISDTITLTNTAPGTGNLQIKFYSDTDPGDLTGLIAAGSACTEPCFANFGSILADETFLLYSIASDGEEPFDPFRTGFDSSDQIKFAGVTTESTPEPATLVLFATGLGFMGLLGWREKARGRHSAGRSAC